MDKMRALLLVAFVVLFSAVALVACGGDDDDAADGNGDEAATTAPAGDVTDAPDDSTEPAGDATTAPADDGDEPADDGEGVTDFCSLMSQDDVSAALGTDVQTPVVTYESTANLPDGSSQATVGTCNYVSPEGFDSISITVWSSPGHSDAIRQMAELACEGKETLDVGDLACWYDSGKAEVQLSSGVHFLDIFATSQGDSAAILETLAGTAVSNLP